MDFLDGNWQLIKEFRPEPVQTYFHTVAAAAFPSTMLLMLPWHSYLFMLITFQLLLFFILYTSCHHRFRFQVLRFYDKGVRLENHRKGTGICWQDVTKLSQDTGFFFPWRLKSGKKKLVVPQIWNQQQTQDIAELMRNGLGDRTGDLAENSPFARWFSWSPQLFSLWLPHILIIGFSWHFYFADQLVEAAIEQNGPVRFQIALFLGGDMDSAHQESKDHALRKAVEYHHIDMVRRVVEFGGNPEKVAKGCVKHEGCDLDKEIQDLLDEHRKLIKQTPTLQAKEMSNPPLQFSSTLHHGLPVRCSNCSDG